jgi:hypothetical protein
MISENKTHIYVTLQREGIHAYPAAAQLPGVEFLAHPHRHIFHVKAQIQVFHDDRELEFILVKRWIESLYGSGALQLNNQSCEMIAQSLIGEIIKQYGTHREVIVDVSEDNENGAVVTRSPIQTRLC